MVLTADQQNLRDFLRETIPLLCKSRLDFQSKFTVEAVIGLTIDDDDLFFVSLNENVSASAELHSKQAGDDLMTQSMIPASAAQGSEEYHPKRKRKKVAQRKETPPIPSLTMSVDEGDIATNLESSEVGLGYIKTEVVDQHHESGLDESGLGAMPGMSSTLMDDSDDDDGGADDGDDYAVDDRSDDDDYKPTPTTATESEARTDDLKMDADESIKSLPLDGSKGKIYGDGHVDPLCEAPTSGHELSNSSTPKKTKTVEHASSGPTGPTHRCDFCSYTTKYKSHLTRHSRVHTGQKFPCDVCGKKYATCAAMKIHKKCVHKCSPLMCDKCGTKFTSKSGLHGHMKVVHKQQHAYICDKCGQHFEVKSHFVSHVNSHYHIKSYCCSDCGKRFTYSHALKRHQASCGGGVKYFCTECQKGFTREDSLKLHIQSKHGDVGFLCMCGKSYKWKQSLFHHQKNCEILQQVAN